MRYYTLFMSILEKMRQNLSSAAVVIGALRVNGGLDWQSFNQGFVSLESHVNSTLRSFS